MSGKVKDLGAGWPRIRKRGSVDWPAGVLRCESLQGVGKGGWKEGSQPKRNNPRPSFIDSVTAGSALFLLLAWMSFSAGSLTSTIWSRPP